MTARFSSHNQSSYRRTCGAATAPSAQICPIMDTAVILAVSIFVCLLSLLLSAAPW